ncbi:hypothetical protein A2U01_0116006, partial [Trifolium medium]|nr:hypothetical protein [Trifolium medium]
SQRLNEEEMSFFWVEMGLSKGLRWV